MFTRRCLLFRFFIDFPSFSGFLRECTLPILLLPLRRALCEGLLRSESVEMIENAGFLSSDEFRRKRSSREVYTNRSRFPVECIASLAVRAERRLSACSLAVRDVYMPVGAGSSPAITARTVRERVWVRRPNVHVTHVSSLRAFLQRAFQIDPVRFTKVVECRWMERVVQVSVQNPANSPEKEGTVITYPLVPVSNKPFGVYTGLRVRDTEKEVRSRAICLRICRRYNKI